MFRKLGWLSVFSLLGCLFLTSVSFGADENTGNALPAYCNKSGQEVNSLSNEQIYECLQWLHNKYGEFYVKYNEKTGGAAVNNVDSLQNFAATEPQFRGGVKNTTMDTEPQFLKLRNSKPQNLLGTEPQF